MVHKRNSTTNIMSEKITHAQRGELSRHVNLPFALAECFNEFNDIDLTDADMKIFKARIQL